MQRKNWFELHDHPKCPAFLRDGLTEALEAIWHVCDLYTPVVPRLRRALKEAGTSRVIDLCSGGGGPWIKLLRDFRRDKGEEPQVWLTDLYPNQSAFDRVSEETGGSIRGVPEPVDAQHIPASLSGFRTIFTAFHHFTPEEGRAILQDAVDQGQGIAVFDAAGRKFQTVLAVFGVPLLAFLLAPRQRPFRWSRFFWNCCIPVIPAILWFDGIMSCLRAYSQEDLKHLTAEVKARNYCWESGEVRGRFVTITFLIGSPLRRQDEIAEKAKMVELETEIESQEIEMPA